MKARDLLRALASRNIRVSLEGDQLQVRAPAGRLETADVEALRAVRTELLDALREAGRWGLLLSGQQERLWFFEQTEPGLSAYTLPGAFRLQGPLDAQALRSALSDFVERHDLARVHVRTVDGTPVLSFAPAAPFDLRVLDAADLVDDLDDREAIEDLVVETGNASLALDEPPLIRFTLIRIGPSEHVLVVLVHHLIWDGWSFDIFLRDAGECYAARVEQREPRLPELVGSYGAFVLDQQGPTEATDAGHRYWAEALAAAPATLELPTDRARPPRVTYDGARIPLAVTQDVLEELRRLCREEGVTLFTLLLAVYAVLLHRLTGQDDLVVAAPMQGRSRQSLEEVVGFFVNTLPLRLRPARDEPFATFLHRVRDVVVGALEHRDTTFDWMVREFGRRDGSRTPLYQTMFTHQFAADRVRRWGDLDISSFARGTRSVTTDLGLWVREYVDRLDGGLDFRTDLWDEASAASMLRAYHALLAAVVSDRRVAVGNLPLLSESEAQAETKGRAGAERMPPREETVLGLVAAEVRRRPDAVAVADSAGTTSFAKLWGHSAATAALLHRAGASGAVVAVLMRRSRQLPTALLGVWRAGATYLPMDPDYPEERLRLMVEDSGVTHALVDGRTEDLARRLGLTALRLPDVETAADVDWRDVAPAASAYRIYTSGSTGRPKGVDIPQLALVSHLHAMRSLTGIAADDVWLAVTTISFDISILELLLPLVAGARVFVAWDAEARGSEAVAEVLAASAATIMQATPVVWRSLLDDRWQGRLRVAVCGGEALSPSLATGVGQHCGLLLHVYGPTETTIWSTATALADASGGVSIGRPIENTTVYVLDEGRRPVPQGARGEIWIGGLGVASGYWNRPELTAERFVSDPFVRGWGGRMYRTGDLGRWRADGQLEFLGRSDAQVKVRGHRIELTEIEAALESLPEVKAAAVDARGHDADRRLVAWVVPTDPVRPPTGSDIRAALRRRLPDAFVPGRFAVVDSIPVLPNGKRDRARLVDPLLDAPVQQPRQDPPQGAVELGIAAEWCALLGIKQVYRDDNFFELGGHSLLALRASAAIARRTGHKIDPRRFFFATLAQLAEPE